MIGTEQGLMINNYEKGLRLSMNGVPFMTIAAKYLFRLKLI